MPIRRIHSQLLSMSEPSYQKFSSSLIPTVDPKTVLGIRMPRLRAYAKALPARDAAAFLAELPHDCFEDNNLHAFLIMGIREFDTCLEEVTRFLPHVDNWATCDSLRPAAFSKNPERLRPAIDAWLESDHPYTVRFAIELLMLHFLEERFDARDLERIAKLQSDHYYVKMMIAWYFATALAKQYPHALPYLEQRRLSPWIHNKTIQKALESYRLTPAQKEHLKPLRRLPSRS